MRRSSLLKYVSFLMMLTAIVRAIFGIGMMNFFVTAKSLGFDNPTAMTLAKIALWLILLCAVAELVGGFVGALNWEEPLGTRKCVAWGAVMLGLGLAGNLVQALTGYGVSYVAWATGAAAPGLFLLAAVRFRVKARKR